MPCRSDDYPRTPCPPVDRIAPAALCAVFSALELNLALDNMLGTLDYKEAGITRKELEEWWAKHKAEDEKKKIKKSYYIEIESQHPDEYSDIAFTSPKKSRLRLKLRELGYSETASHYSKAETWQHPKTGVIAHIRQTKLLR